MVTAAELHLPVITNLTELWAQWEGQNASQKVKGGQGEPSGTSGEPREDLKALKLAVFKDVVLYYLKGDTARYKRLMDDLHSYQVEKFPIDHRLKRANEGKEVANKKYKDGNPVQAMYTYAIAWGLLLPYFPEQYPKGDPYRTEIGKIECALFSNISAMAIMEAKKDDIASEQKESLAQIGMDASEVCISAKEFVTVGIMLKSCRRARELAPLSGSRDVPTDRIRFFQEQEKNLEGLNLGMMFADLSADKIAAPTRVD